MCLAVQTAWSLLSDVSCHHQIRQEHVLACLDERHMEGLREGAQSAVALHREAALASLWSHALLGTVDPCGALPVKEWYCSAGCGMTAKERLISRM